MSRKKIFGLSNRLLLFLIPVIAGSLLVSGILTTLYTDKGVKMSMNRLMVYKAEDLMRYANQQWSLLLENDLQNDPVYIESIRRSIRSYAITMLRSEGEWILAVDRSGAIQFSVGDTPPDEKILETLNLLPELKEETGDIRIDGKFGGIDRVGYGFQLPAMGWTVMITDHKASYFGNITYIRTSYILMMALSTVITVLFVSLFIRRSMHPMKTVIADMQAIVKNRDFDRRVITVQNDEVGELAREFNLMSDYLELAMARLKNIAHSQTEARIEIRNRERETLEFLGRVSDFRDEGTSLHIRRVGMYASLLSRLRGDSEEEADLMRWAVPLHDIGKIGIPDSILLKKKGLTAKERKIAESHAQIGYEILKNSASPILRAGADIAIFHHENWDGSGYPGGLKGTEIPVRGRITHLLDVFDAVTSVRSYKKPWTLDGGRHLYTKGQRHRI